MTILQETMYVATCDQCHRWSDAEPSEPDLIDQLHRAGWTVSAERIVCASCMPRPALKVVAAS